MQEQEDMSTAENVMATTRKPGRTFEEMPNDFGDILRDLASSNNEQDGEEAGDNEEDAELGKLSDDEPGQEMGAISKTVQHCKGRFRQKQVRLDDLTQQ